jgi:hypothetical protein
MMADKVSEEKMLAHVLYTIRGLLAGNLGSENQSPIEVRVAAHLAYAVHNEALAAIEGKSFDIDAALKKIEAIDQILDVKDGTSLSNFMKTGQS